MDEQVLQTLLGAKARDMLVLVAATCTRIGLAIWIMPVFAGRLVPPTVRLAITAALVVLIFPHLQPAALALSSLGPVGIGAVVVKEAFVGFAFGFVASTVFWAAQAAGWLMDASRGSRWSELTTPLGGERTSALGNLMLLLTVVLYLVLGGHRLLIGALLRSYQVLPIDRFPDLEGLKSVAMFCITLSAELIAFAVVVAAPVVAALLLSDLVLGWVNRFAPQVNVFFLAMPVKAILGIAVFAVCLTVVFQVLPEALGAAVSRVWRALDMFAAAGA